MNARTDIPAATSDRGWFKSSYSSNNGNECVEVNLDNTAVSLIGDTKLKQHGPVLAVAPTAFAAFVSAAAGGQLV